MTPRSSFVQYHHHPHHHHLHPPLQVNYDGRSLTPRSTCSTPIVSSTSSLSLSLSSSSISLSSASSSCAPSSLTKFLAPSKLAQPSMRQHDPCLKGVISGGSIPKPIPPNLVSTSKAKSPSAMNAAFLLPFVMSPIVPSPPCQQSNKTEHEENLSTNHRDLATSKKFSGVIDGHNVIHDNNNNVILGDVIGCGDDEISRRSPVVKRSMSSGCCNPIKRTLSAGKLSKSSPPTFLSSVISSSHQDRLLLSPRSHNIKKLTQKKAIASTPGPTAATNAHLRCGPLPNHSCSHTLLYGGSRSDDGLGSDMDDVNVSNRLNNTSETSPLPQPRLPSPSASTPTPTPTTPALTPKAVPTTAEKDCDDYDICYNLRDALTSFENAKPQTTLPPHHTTPVACPPTSPIKCRPLEDESVDLRLKTNHAIEDLQNCIIANTTNTIASTSTPSITANSIHNLANTKQCEAGKKIDVLDASQELAELANVQIGSPRPSGFYGLSRNYALCDHSDRGNDQNNDDVCPLLSPAFSIQDKRNSGVSFQFNVSSVSDDDANLTPMAYNTPQPTVNTSVVGRSKSWEITDSFRNSKLRSNCAMSNGPRVPNDCFQVPSKQFKTGVAMHRSKLYQRRLKSRASKIRSEVVSKLDAAEKIAAFERKLNIQPLRA